MALVSYSDSEGSDSESTPAPQIPKTTKPAPATATTNPSKLPSKPSSTFQPLVDRSNPRKILVNLSDADKEKRADGTTNDENGDNDDGPARKRARIGSGGGFSGFNSLLPAPKRTGAAVKPGSDGKAGAARSARRVFSLKTGAEPGFDRQADAEMKWNLNAAASAAGGGDGGVVGEGGEVATSTQTAEPSKEEGETPVVKITGNAMRFKPLSVARNTTKKKTRTVAPSPATTVDGGKTASTGKTTTEEPKTGDTVLKPAPKPKVSLFGFGAQGQPEPAAAPQPSAAYEPLIYNTSSESTSLGAEPSTAPAEPSTYQPSEPPAPQQAQSLASIADDLNLSRAEKRQLFGRQAASASNASTAQSNPNIITFNTDQEYNANASYLTSASEAELAAQQHNPLRSIAPGKHSLQQLVNAVSTQREALEDSFATGKRNKKEAGTKYGW
ncbi:hypothetical protein FQN50_008559 [Emmonsiellopsis sp. PD_5]|nr:hypothetical protein FQN50_008559 [Emmonsiellopsis sp. PD_5]